MKIIETEFFHGRKSRKFTIFSIHSHNEYFASGSINGELKIYYKDTFKTYNDHVGTVLCVRFSENGQSLATGGDDGCINIYNFSELEKKFLHQKRVKQHEIDISEIIWTERMLLSCNYSGDLLAYERNGFNLIKKINLGEICRGMCYNRKYEMIVVQCESFLKVYNMSLEEINESKEIFIGKIHEAFFSRCSWSPDGLYYSVGLAFNSTHDSVEILNKNGFSSEFSFLGHVAPTEVVKFNPNIYTYEDQIYYILALASQDRSISFWNSRTNTPFLLLKNIFSGPILDMFWDKNVLFACSYDGNVRKMVFDDLELGKILKSNTYQNNNEIVVPLTLDNIYLHQKIQHFIGLEHSNETQKTHPLEEELKEIIDVQQPNIKMVLLGSVDPEVQIENNEKTLEKVENNNKNVKRKIKPILIQPLEAVEERLQDKSKEVYVLFEGQKKKQKHSISNIQHPFKISIRECKFIIKEGARYHLSLYKGEFLFFEISFEKILQFKATYKYFAVVVVNQDIQELLVYKTETATLVIPSIVAITFISIDIYGDNLFLLTDNKTFQILDLEILKNVINGSLEFNDTLINIKLDKKYFLIAYYKSCILFYNKKLKSWFNLKHKFNTIMLSNRSKIQSEPVFDDFDDDDQTIQDLEYKFIISELNNNLPGMISIAKRLCKLVKKNYTLNDHHLSIIDNLFEKLIFYNEKRVVYKLLEELNAVDDLQPFVIEMIDKIRILSE